MGEGEFQSWGGGDRKKSNWERKVPTKAQRVSSHVVVDGDAVWVEGRQEPQIQN